MNDNREEELAMEYAGNGYCIYIFLGVCVFMYQQFGKNHLPKLGLMSHVLEIIKKSFIHDQ